MYSEVMPEEKACYLVRCKSRRYIGYLGSGHPKVNCKYNEGQGVATRIIDITELMGPKSLNCFALEARKANDEQKHSESSPT